MRHRLYYLLPDIESARRTFDDMLLSRIEQRHVRFLTAGAALPDYMPEANILIKTDLLHGLATGSAIGAVLGIGLGALLISYFDAAQAIIFLTTLVGIFFGGWAASMAGAAIPNSRLKSFYPDLEKGKVLMIADIPARRVGQIEKMLAERHPEIWFGGEEPNVPVFP